MLSAVLVPAYFVFAPKTTHIPYDLRDAVADNAFDSLNETGATVNVPEVPAPEEQGTSSAKSIYGRDDRKDYYDVDASMKALSDSVVSLWQATDLTPAGGNMALKVAPFGRLANLCPGEKFAEQPIGPFCSGTLVGPDMVMTAGHCITDAASCASTRFVFGFALKKEGEYPKAVPAGDVYACAGIVKRDLDLHPGLFASIFNGGPGPDFALVRLNRKVTNRRPLAVNRRSKPAKGDRLFVIGHPVGLPLKVADNAQVRKASPKYFFTADLDTFGGNSGSAVFNARTRLIEGILVRGDTDFVMSPGGCRVASVVPQNGGKGEAVTKISVLEQFIP
jgi:hypothetical protein